MGFISHKTLVFTDSLEDCSEVAQVGAEFGLSVLGPGDKQTNGYATVVFPSCGSKSGWQEERDHAERLDLMIKWLRKHRRISEWALVSYGFDEGCARVKETSCNHSGGD